MEHVSKFLDAMGPYVGNRDLCLQEFSKSLTDRTYTCYTSLRPASIPAWEGMVESFCNRYFNGEERITLLSLHNTRQKDREDLLEYIKRQPWISRAGMKKGSWWRYVQTKCYQNIVPTWSTWNIVQFAQLLQKARKTATFVKPHLEKQKEKKAIP